MTEIHKMVMGKSFAELDYKILLEVAEFCVNNRVELLMQDDCQFHCFINYKEGDGSYGIGLNSLDALIAGYLAFIKQSKKV